MTIGTTSTDGSGRYLFGGLAAGSYRVRFMPPAGLTFSSPHAGSDAAKDSEADIGTGLTGCYLLPAGQTNLTVDAGLVPGCRPNLIVSVECQDPTAAGQPVTFTGWVSNDGDGAVTNAVLTHSVLGVVKTFGTLAPGVTTNFTGTFTPAGCGDLTSSVTLTGRDACSGVALSLPEPFTCSVPCPDCPSCVDPLLGLGAAAGCTVLQLGSSKVEITGPAGGILGDVCVAPGGKLTLSGDEYITGKVRLGAGATTKNSSSTWINVLTNVDLSTQISAATSAAASAAGLPCTQSYVKLDGKTVTTLTGVAGPNVICVGDLTLSGKQLTLTGPVGARFIFDVSGKFTLSGGGAGPQIRVAGGVQPKDVLYNILGAGSDVAFSGGGGGVDCCAAIVDGTILAPQRKIKLSPGLVNGQIISGQDISIASGSSVRCPPCSAAPRGFDPGMGPELTGLSAVVSPGQIALAWNDRAGATSYQVWRSTNSGGGADGYQLLQAGLTAPGCLDASTSDGVVYFYLVTATLTDLETAYSGELIVGLVPPLITRLEILSATGRRLSLVGHLGYDYVIEASADLVNWQVIATVPNTDGTIQFTDPDGAASAFYRVKIAP
jgi:choice-of-anchor A domain-containing protein